MRNENEALLCLVGSDAAEVDPGADSGLGEAVRLLEDLRAEVA